MTKARSPSDAHANIAGSAARSAHRYLPPRVDGRNRVSPWRNRHWWALPSCAPMQASQTPRPEFVDVPAPTGETLQAVLHKIITRTMGLLTRQGVLVEDEGSTYMADNDGDSDEARVLRPLQAAACTYRIAFGPRAGQKVLTLQGAERGHGPVPADGPVPREGLAPASASAACRACRESRTSPRRCAPTTTGSARRLVSPSGVRQAQGPFRTLVSGLTLHAAVRCAANDRQALEQLCR